MQVDSQKKLLHVGAAFLFFGLLNPVGRAQDPAAAGAAQSFEVASIKPSATDSRAVAFQITPGRYTARGITAKLLLQQAYDIRDFQISGGPGWITTDRYDIVAKAETGNLTRETIKAMLQSLLAERFKLQIHRETKDLPIYLLVVGKDGPKLHASENQPDTTGDVPPLNAPKAGGQGQVAHMVAGSGPAAKGLMRMGPGQLNAQTVPISSLALSLSQVLGRPVLDKTNLKGNYDFDLQWAPDEGQRGAFEKAISHDNPAPVDDSGPSIFTVLQEQLGLKLESARGPVEILVIDRIEKPTEN